MKSSGGGSSHGDMGLFLYQQSLFLIKTFFGRSMSKHAQLKKNQESWGNCVMIELGLTYSRYFVGAQQGFEMLICKH